jgi:hypothetical protein
LCPPYYHIYLEGLGDVWDVGLFDPKGKPIQYEQFATKNGKVLSFRPDKSHYLDGQIGDYLLAFEMGPAGKVNNEYRVNTRVDRSDRPYQPPRK